MGHHRAHSLCRLTDCAPRTDDRQEGAAHSEGASEPPIESHSVGAEPLGELTGRSRERQHRDEKQHDGPDGAGPASLGAAQRQERPGQKVGGEGSGGWSQH